MSVTFTLFFRFAQRYSFQYLNTGAIINLYVTVGITNHDEYSLVRDMPDDEKMKTLTIKRDKSIAKDQKKLDEMKKKLHTDDDRKFNI